MGGLRWRWGLNGEPFADGVCLCRESSEAGIDSVLHQVHPRRVPGGGLPQCELLDNIVEDGAGAGDT